MENLFDKFLDEIETFIVATGLDEKEICNDAFNENAMCECTYRGSGDYFDTRMGQWYPGDAPEYEVTGYKDYMDTIIQTVADAFASYYDVPMSNDIINFIRENITDIFQDALLDEDAFEEKAIENF